MMRWIAAILMTAAFLSMVPAGNAMESPMSGGAIVAELGHYRGADHAIQCMDSDPCLPNCFNCYLAAIAPFPGASLTPSVGDEIAQPFSVLDLTRRPYRPPKHDRTLKSYELIQLKGNQDA